MDWFKYDRLIHNRQPVEQEQGKQGEESTVTPPCRPNCWLRTYNPLNATPERTNFQPYAPKASQVYGKIKTTQIRILRLHPGRGNEVVVTELLPARISNTQGMVEIDVEDELVVSYRILSYSWGYGGNTTYIICNGVHFEVLDSLCQALLELRDPKEPLYYWIDAVCINQTDPVEKGFQITKIFTLYSQASMTVAWLGRADQCGYEAFRFIEEFDGKEHHLDCLRGIGIVCQQMSVLAQRPWFTRTWVRQEVFASQKLFLRVGSRQYGYRQFVDHVQSAYKWLKQIQTSSHNASPSFDTTGLSQLFTNLDTFKRVAPEDLQPLVARNHPLLLEKFDLSPEFVFRKNVSFKATNARDYIYGVISMTSAPTYVEKTQHSNFFGLGPPLELDKSVTQHRVAPFASLPIRYSSPLARVFAETTLYVMRFHESLDLIFLHSQLPEYQLESPASGIRDANLPSWATDWRQVSQWSFLDSVWMLMDDMIYRDGSAMLYGRVKSEKASHPDQEGDCGIRRTGAAWNDKASFEKFAGRRTVLGSHNCSEFSLIRDLMHSHADFGAFMQDGLMKLQCKGAILGVLKPESPRGGQPRASTGPKKRFRDKMNPLFQTQQSFNVTQRYFKETATYMNLVAAEASQALFKPMDVELIEEVVRGIPDPTSLYKSNKFIARHQDYNDMAEQGGWSVSQFCHMSDIGRILIATPCLAPKTAQEGDIIVMLRGCSLPAVMRRAHRRERLEYQLIGPLINWRYVAEENLRRETAEMWSEYGSKFQFHPEFERKPAPLEEDLSIEKFVLI